MLSVGTVRVAGLEVVYDRAGSGPPLVLVHGAAGDAREWRAQVAGLSDDFTVIASDEPGAGRSSDVPADFGLAGYATGLAALIEALDAPAHVCGLSWAARSSWSSIGARVRPHDPARGTGGHPGRGPHEQPGAPGRVQRGDSRLLSSSALSRPDCRLHASRHSTAGGMHRAPVVRFVRTKRYEGGALRCRRLRPPDFAAGGSVRPTLAAVGVALSTAGPRLGTAASDYPIRAISAANCGDPASPSRRL